MSTSDRFDRHLERLFVDLASSAMPAYIDDVLAVATARPQRRPSILARLGVNTAGPRFRAALAGVAVLVALGVLVVSTLVIGGPPRPTLQPTSSQSAVPSAVATPRATTTPSQTTATPPTALEPCDGYARAADAKVVDAAGQIAWSSKTGPARPVATLRDGVIAGFVERLDTGPAVVLVDPVDATACRLIDLEPGTDPWGLAWSPAGDALALSLGQKVLVWSSAGLTMVRDVPDGSFGAMLAWSPIGDTLATAYNTKAPITLVFADGSRRDVAIENAWVAWSPDGSRFAAIGMKSGDSKQTQRLFVVSSDGLHTDEIDAQGGLIGWLDEQTIAGAAPGGTGALEAFDLGRRAWRSWAPAPNEPIGLTSDIGYAPGVTGLAFFANKSIDEQGAPMDLIVRDLPSGSRRVLAASVYPPASAFGTGTWSPDGTHIAISVLAVPNDPRAHAGIWIYSVGGGEPTFVSAVELTLSEGSWQPLP